jgi:hypothetical protein
MEELGKWKPVFVQLKLQSDNSFKEGEEKRNALILLIPSSHPSNSLLVCPIT